MSVGSEKASFSCTKNLGAVLSFLVTARCEGTTANRKDKYSDKVVNSLTSKFLSRTQCLRHVGFIQAFGFLKLINVHSPLKSKDMSCTVCTPGPGVWSPRCITLSKIIITPFLAACLDPSCYSATASRKSTEISLLVGLQGRCAAPLRDFKLHLLD